MGKSVTVLDRLRFRLLFVTSILFVAVPFPVAARPVAVPAVRLVTPAAAQASPFRLSAIAAGTSSSTLQGMSADGAHLYHQTRKSLNVGDPAGANKLYDIHAGQARLVTTGSFPAFRGATPDGMTIAFTTDLALTPDDTGSADTDLYIRTGTDVRLVTKSIAGHRFGFEAIANDGSAVVFSTIEPLPGAVEVSALREDLVRWDAATNELTLLTPDTSDSVEFLAASSDLEGVLLRTSDDVTGLFGRDREAMYERVDGEYVFRSAGSFKGASVGMDRVYIGTGEALVAEDVDDLWDGYAWDRQAAAYELLTPNTPLAADIGQVADDGASWLVYTAVPLIPADTDDTQDVYRSSKGSAPILISRTGAASWSVRGNGDLSVLVASTSSALVPDDTDGAADLYRVALADLDTPELLTAPTIGESSRGTWLLTISPDGTSIAIRTAEPLVPEDTDTYSDVYVWRAGERHLISAGTTSEVFDAMVSEDASRVAFVSQQSLDPSDTNPYPDWYIADFDTTAPTAAIGGPTGLTTSTSADLSFTTTGGAARSVCRIDSAAWTACPSDVHLAGLADGIHSAEMNAWDAVGNGPGVATRTWTIDATKPTVTGPSASVPAGTRMGATSAVVRVGWAGIDATSGIATSRLEQQTDGGAWVEVGAAVVGFSTNRTLPGGHIYRFRVVVRDRAGNASLVATGSPFTLATTQESSPTITWTGTWGTLDSTASMGGRVRHASSSTARASHGFTGLAVSWVSTRGPTRGSVAVWIDGTYRTTISLYSTTVTTRAVVYRAAWTSIAPHRIELRVAGTVGHPQVDVDAFIVIGLRPPRLPISPAS